MQAIERSKRWGWILGGILLLIPACNKKSSHDTALQGQKVYQQCIACHGPSGAGNRDLGAPAIAGLKAWYVTGQLRKYKSGIRGSHPEDAEGARMRPIAQGLSEDDITAVAAAIAQMPPEQGTPTVEGDPERGHKYWARCTSCHGPYAAGDPQSGAAPLNVSNDWYYLSQIEKFKNGQRGTHPDDTHGAVMRSVALTLNRERTTKDLIAYIATLP